MNNRVGRGKQWKAVKLDWQTLETYSDDERCNVCLTERQAAALLSYIEGMRWKTRWENLPPAFDLDAWIADIEDGLINVACNCGATSSQCICELVSLLQQQIKLTAEINVTVPEIPPNNPGENYPAIDSTDPIVATRRDAYLCDLSFAFVDAAFEGMYQAAIEYCDNQRSEQGINWQAIATGAGLVVATLALGPAGGAVAVSLYYASIAVGLSTIGAEIERYVQATSGDDCDNVQRVDPAVRRAYGCQLFNAVIGAINYTNFRGAFDTQDTQVINALIASGLTATEANDVDDNLRPLLAEFVIGDAFQAFIQTIAAAGDNPYYEGAICDDCVTCGTTPTLIQSWTDPKITTLTGNPTIIGATDILATWPANGWDEVTIGLDDYYCWDQIGFEVARAIVASQPTAIDFIINGVTVSSTFGGNGVNDERVALGGRLARYITIKPGNAASAAAELPLRLSGPAPAGIRIFDRA